MKNRATVFAILVLAITVGAIAASTLRAQDAKKPTRLAVVWTSGDVEVAHNVCLMYTHAAKKAKWFDEVRLVIWGPSAPLFVEDKELQKKIAQMRKDGVEVQACIMCAKNYGVVEDIRSHGIEVKGMGQPLSQMLQGDWKVITF